jgi:hypothetical protein
MRTLFLILLLVSVVAAPLQAQVCRAGPPPTLSTLFPNQIADLDREFYDMRDGCLTNIYKPRNYIPASDAEDPMWAVVMIEPQDDPFLGASAEAMKDHYGRTEMDIYEADGWPITGVKTSVGHEFVTLKGDLRVTIMVKQAKDLASAWGLAETFFAEILPKVLIRCET